MSRLFEMSAIIIICSSTSKDFSSDKNEGLRVSACARFAEANKENDQNFHVEYHYEKYLI